VREYSRISAVCKFRIIANYFGLLENILFLLSTWKIIMH